MTSPKLLAASKSTRTVAEVRAARSGSISATYEPQGTCPNGWVARVNGEPVRTSAGGIRRYGSEASALKAAKAAEASR